MRSYQLTTYSIHETFINEYCVGSTMPPPYLIGKPQVIRQFSLNYKHVFNMEYLYKRMKAWLDDEGYEGESISGERSDNWLEHFYLDRSLAPGVKQIWAWWRSYKDFSPFIKFHLHVDYHVLGLTNHEIVVDGKKIKTHKGECETFITAKMTVDPKMTWNDHFLLKNSYVQNFYLNRIYKQKIEFAEQQLVKDSARLLGALKQYMQLESWLPEYQGESFVPPKGIEGAKY